MGNQTSIPMGYKKCADENGQCKIDMSPMPTVLYYGGEQNYKMIPYPPNTNSNIVCNNQTMGGDPAVGKQKACYIPDSSISEEKRPCNFISTTVTNDNETNTKYIVDCKFPKEQTNSGISNMTNQQAQNPEHFINLREKYGSVDYEQLLLVVVVLLILYLVYNNCNQ